MCSRHVILLSRTGRSSTPAIYTSLSPSKNVIKVSLVKSITTQQFQSTDDRPSFCSMAIFLLLSARLPLLKGNLHSRYDVEGRFVPSSPHDPSLTPKTAWKSPPFPRKEFEFIKNFCFIMFYGHQSFEKQKLPGTFSGTLRHAIKFLTKNTLIKICHGIVIRNSDTAVLFKKAAMKPDSKLYEHYAFELQGLSPIAATMQPQQN